jgi:cyclase
MDKDGTKTGYDLELTKAVASLVSIPVIASGGAGNLDDLYKGFKIGLASAVLAASIFHYKNHTVKEAKNYLKKRNILIRE